MPQNEVPDIGRRIQTTSRVRLDMDFRVGCMESWSLRTRQAARAYQRDAFNIQVKGAPVHHDFLCARTFIEFCCVGPQNAAPTTKVDVCQGGRLKTLNDGDPGADVWLHDWLLLGTSSSRPWAGSCCTGGGPSQHLPSLPNPHGENSC